MLRSRCASHPPTAKSPCRDNRPSAAPHPQPQPSPGTERDAPKTTKCPQTRAFLAMLGTAAHRLCNVEEYGAQGRDRTADTVIFSHVLYQLSYLGTGALEGGL
jgi:hypothetical protein